MKVLAIDYGLTRTGIAIGDSEFGIAFEKDPILSDDNIFLNILKLCIDNDIRIVIIGNPKNLNYSHSNQTQVVNEFSNKLKEYLSKKFDQEIEIHLIDERFSTLEAKKKMIAKNRKNFEKQKDSLAAMNILQTYFEIERGNLR